MVTEKMIEALKPCPFCGGEPIEFRVPGYGKLWRIECKSCDAGPASSLDIEDARTIWNARFEAALSTDAEPVGWRVYDVSVSRAHSRAQAPDISTEALYPASREKDAREYARIMHGECQPLYAHLPVSDLGEKETSDGECREADGCPTEKAVLQRFWRAHHNTRQQPALSAQVQDVAGMKLMPHEPTQEMIDAAMCADQDGFSASMKTIWMVMWGTFAAAPAAKLEEKP